MVWPLDFRFFDIPPFFLGASSSGVVLHRVPLIFGIFFTSTGSECDPTLQHRRLLETARRYALKARPLFPLRFLFCTFSQLCHQSYVSLRSGCRLLNSFSWIADTALRAIWCAILGCEGHPSNEHEEHVRRWARENEFAACLFGFAPVCHFGVKQSSFMCRLGIFHEFLGPIEAEVDRGPVESWSAAREASCACGPPRTTTGITMKCPCAWSHSPGRSLRWGRKGVIAESTQIFSPLDARKLDYERSCARPFSCLPEEHGKCRLVIKACDTRWAQLIKVNMLGTWFPPSSPQFAPPGRACNENSPFLKNFPRILEHIWAQINGWGGKGCIKTEGKDAPEVWHVFSPHFRPYHRSFRPRRTLQRKFPVF